jgi:hypothetical protein
VDPVNIDKALVTEYRQDNLNISCGGNTIDILVFLSGSLMPRRWRPHHQDRAGRLTPCMFQNLIVFKRSMRKKSRTDYLLMNQCSQIMTQIGQYNFQTLYHKGRLWNPQGSRKRGRPKNSWRRLVIKEVGRSWNELRFLGAHRQVERTSRQPMFIQKGATDSIITTTNTTTDFTHSSTILEGPNVRKPLSKFFVHNVGKPFIPLEDIKVIQV